MIQLPDFGKVDKADHPDDGTAHCYQCLPVCRDGQVSDWEWPLSEQVSCRCLMNIWNGIHVSFLAQLVTKVPHPGEQSSRCLPSGRGSFRCQRQTSLRREAIPGM